MKNAIALLKKDLENHRVVVILPGETEKKSLFLVMTGAKVNKLEDFKKTYGSKVTATHLKIAAKIFKEGETENVYGVFMDDNLQMVFAFNRDFADYSPKKEMIIYKEIDDLLVDGIEPKKSGSDTETFPRKNFSSNSMPGSGMITYRYGIFEKPKKK